VLPEIDMDGVVCAGIVAVEHEVVGVVIVEQAGGDARIVGSLLIKPTRSSSVVVAVVVTLVSL